MIFDHLRKLKSFVRASLLDVLLELPERSQFGAIEECRDLLPVALRKVRAFRKRGVHRYRRREVAGARCECPGPAK